MAVYPCHGASIYFTPSGGSATLLPGLVDADVTMSQDIIEVTESNDRDRMYVQGIRSGSANCTVFYDQASHGAFETALVDGSEVQFEFRLHAQTGGNKAAYTVNCLVRDFSPKIAVNDVIRATMSLQFTGAVTIA